MAVYDCFTFFNEIDLLKIRLSMLDSIVDKFVIVELNKTYRGKEKEYNFLKHQSEFKRFKDKIIYITAEDIPKSSGSGDWTIAHFQRNCIMRGLNCCQPEDIIIISDLDEIPNPEIIKNLHSHHANIISSKSVKGILKQVFRILTIDFDIFFKNYTVKDLLEKTSVVCRQKLFYYYMNCQSKGMWHGSVISKYKNIRTPQILRDLRNKLPYIEDGGWHFSYLGGIEKIKTKVTCIVGGVDKYVSDENYVRDCLDKGKDLYGRKGKEFEYQFISPESIGIENIDKIMIQYPFFFKKIKI